MSKTFDELFNDFLRRCKKKSQKPSEPSNNFDAIKLINLLDKISILNNVDEDTEKSLDISLGNPDKIEYYMEDDLYCEKRSWNTPNGVLVKLTMSDTPLEEADYSDNKKSSKNISIEERLELAIKNEDYEEAARLHKEIEENKNNQKEN